jgi:hypothetical protein
MQFSGNICPQGYAQGETSPCQAKPWGFLNPPGFHAHEKIAFLKVFAGCLIALMPSFGKRSTYQTLEKSAATALRGKLLGAEVAKKRLVWSEPCEGILPGSVAPVRFQARSSPFHRSLPQEPDRDSKQRLFPVFPRQSSKRARFCLLHLSL